MPDEPTNETPPDFRTLLQEWLSIPTGNLPTIGASDSIQEQYDHGQRSFFVLPSYERVNDPEVLMFDNPTPGPLSLMGMGASTTTLPPIVVDGYGHEAYKQAPTLSGFSVVGGEPGIKLRGSPFASLSDIYVSSNGHGVVLASDSEGNSCNSVTMHNVQTYGCKKTGFLETRGSQAHSTVYSGCRATANKGHGFIINGANCVIDGGDAQLNYQPGIRVNSPACSISGVYVEGNGRGENAAHVELYGQDAHGLKISDCYFHGINPRGAPWIPSDAEPPGTYVDRGVNVHDSMGVSVRDCVYLRYQDAFCAFFGCDSPDIHERSHVLLKPDSVPSLVSPGGQTEGLLSAGMEWIQ